MNSPNTIKRARRIPSYGIGHGATPHIVPPSTLDEFLANHGITPTRYKRIIKQYFGKKPEMLKRTG